MNRFFLVALGFGMLTTGTVGATPLDDKVQALKKAVQAESDQKAKAADANPRETATAAMLASSLDQMVSQGDENFAGMNPEAQLSQLTAMYTSDEVRKALADVLAELRQERDDKAKAQAEKLTALLKRTTDEVNAAKKPEDLDDLLVELQKSQTARYGGGAYPPANQALTQQISSAFEFVKAWQSYLSDAASGHGEQARNELQSISQNSTGVGIIPRSRILQLLASASPVATAGVPPAPGPSPTAQILGNIKTLDDLAGASESLSTLKPQTPDSQSALNHVNAMRQAYEAIGAGLPSNINNGYAPNLGDFQPKLQAQLIVMMLEHYFESFKGPAPTLDEKPQAFLSRALADATSRQDWVLLQRVFTAQAYLNRSASFAQFGPGLTSGADSLLAALNQETAGQYAPAVQSFEQALRAADPSIPAKFIGDHLAAIQKDHPKEYEQGVKVVQSEVPVSSAMQNMMGPGRFGYPYYMGVPAPPMPTANAPAPPAPATQVGTPVAPKPQPGASPASTNASPVSPAK